MALDEHQPDDDADEPLRRAEARLFVRAVRARWPIPDVTRRRLVRKANRFLKGGEDVPDRTVLGAMKVLLAADRLNLDQEALELRREELNRAATAAETLADAVAKAEQLAEEHLRGRDDGGGG